MKPSNEIVLVCGLAAWFIYFSMLQMRNIKDASGCGVERRAGMTSYQVSQTLYAKTVPMHLISEQFPAPCLIHRTSKRPNALESMSNNDKDLFVNSWRQFANPLCNTLLWHDQAGNDLVRVYEPQLLPEYTWLATGTERGDVVRLVALYHMGGIYADLDISVVRDLTEWTYGYSGVGAIFAMEYCRNNTRYHKTDYGVVQFAFASVPHHRVVRRALDMIGSLVHEERTTGNVYYKNYGYNAKIMRRTGPVVLSNAVKEELESRGLTWRNVCEAGGPYMIPDTDILILPRRSFNAPHKYVPSHGVLRHYYHSEWAVRSRSAWYVPP